MCKDFAREREEGGRKVGKFLGCKFFQSEGSWKGDWMQVFQNDFFFKENLEVVMEFMR